MYNSSGGTDEGGPKERNTHSERLSNGVSFLSLNLKLILLLV